MKSSTVTVAPILGCLRAGLTHVGKQAKFSTTNDKQKNFIEKYGMRVEDDITKLGNLLRSFASIHYEDVNKFLKDNGFSIQLNPPPPGSFACASVLDVLVEWAKVGKPVTVKRNWKDYPAVDMKEGVSILRSDDGHIVVQVGTKPAQNDRPLSVWMSPLKRDELDNPEPVLMALAEANPINYVTSGEYAGVQFPMVDYDEQIDISWLEGLRITDDWFVSQALQQTKFKMNEKGASAKSGAAMAMTKGCSVSKPRLVIDSPFMLWITKRGVRFPVFAGTFFEDSWKMPKSLD